MKINIFTFRGGVNASNDATFRLFDLKSNLMFLLRKIRNTILRHAELISASNVTETLKRVQGDNKIEHKTLCHSELGSESRDVETKKRVQGDIKIEDKPLCHYEFILKSKGILNNILTAKKAFAFTLAETLIVMGIIGVVAALTIPNLNSSTADKEKVAKVKKIYSNLNDALGRAQVVYGPVEEWKQLDSTAVAQTARFGERLTEFMKVSKNCKMEVNKGCLSSAKVKSIGAVEDKNYDGDNSVYKFITADGTSIYFTSNGAFVDIDGPIKGSTQYGKDIFLFQLADNDFVPMRKNEFSSYLTELTAGSGFSASGWIIDYDNMDYLKLTKDQKCPNGKTPTEQNPRCK